jgi:hypothetical protein
LYINQPLTKYFYRTDCKSLNKDIESNLKSMAYIRNKYKDDIKKLSKKQMSEKYEYEFSSTAHRLLLNYNRTLSSKYYLKAFLVRLKVKFLIASIFSLLYPKLIFKLR